MLAGRFHFANCTVSLLRPHAAAGALLQAAISPVALHATFAAPSARPARAREQRLAAARDDFAAWLAANPLPRTAWGDGEDAVQPTEVQTPLGGSSTASAFQVSELARRLEALHAAYPG